MSKTVACIIARTVSSRLPFKVLRYVTNEYHLIEFIIHRLKLVSSIDAIYLCTSKENVDDILEDIAAKNKIAIFRGSADKVIDRMIKVGMKENADNLIRVTGDNVFTAFEYIDQMIRLHNEKKLDYTRVENLPVGATAEIMRYKALMDCYHSVDPKVTEYLMLFMFNPDKYKCGVLTNSKQWSNYSLTVDTPEDLMRTKAVLAKYQSNDKLKIKLKEIMSIISKKDIPHTLVEEDGKVKLPYGKHVTFRSFQKEMQKRAKKSIQFILT